MQTQMTDKRKLHDFWAAALYIITTLTVYGLVYAMVPSTKMEKDTLGFLTKGFGMSVGTTLVVMLLYFISLLFFPKFLIHFGFIFIIVFNFVIGILSRNAFIIVISIISGLFIGYFYFFLIFRYIKLTSIVLNEAAKIILTYSLPIVSMLGVISLIYIANLMVLLPRLLAINYDKDGWVFLLVFLNLTWTEFNGLYFFIVLVASIVAYHLYNRGVRSGTAASSIKNTCYCIGSICLGGLLVAAVKTLRFMVDRVSQRDDRRERNSFVVILAMIASVLLYILEDIIRLMNDFLFVYMAVHGKSYKQSLMGSYEISTNPRNYVLLNSIAADAALTVLVFAAMCIYILVGWVLLGKEIKVLFEQKHYILLFYPTALFMFSIVSFSSCISGAVKAIMFVRADNETCVKDMCPRIDKELKELESKQATF